MALDQAWEFYQNLLYLFNLQKEQENCKEQQLAQNKQLVVLVRQE